MERLIVTTPAMFLPMLAEASLDPTAMGWIDLVRTLGIAGILAWYLYHTTTVTLPKLNEKYTESVQKISDTNNATVQRICKEFQDSIKEERDARREEVADLKATIRCRNYLPNHPIDIGNGQPIARSENH